MHQTLILSHPFLLQHGKDDHPENQFRLSTAFKKIEKANYEIDCSVERLATTKELGWVHTTDYINQVLSYDGQEVDLDFETPLSKNSVRSARLAAGLGLEMIDRVVLKQIKSGFVLVRPPGHHARPQAGMGYCIFNNIAIAAKSALNQGMSRVLILDWDVHHGNGTQEVFYNDDRVYLIDLHQEDLFPRNSGLVEERGAERGRGYTLNIPLPEFSNDADYLHIFDRIVRPVVTQYQPELILVSAGFDAHDDDPMGSMCLTTDGYGKLMQRLKGLANDVCEGRFVLFLEGGYNKDPLSDDILRCVEVLFDESDLSLRGNKSVMPAHHEEVNSIGNKIYESCVKNHS